MCRVMCRLAAYTLWGAPPPPPELPNFPKDFSLCDIVNVESQYCRDEERMQRALVAGDHMYRIGRRMSVRSSSQFVREKALNDEETLGYGGATSRRSKGSTDRIIKNYDPKLGI